MNQRQRVVKLERRAESLGRARKRRDRERVALRNRPHLEGRLRDDAERAERSGHHLHQIIAGDVFDHPAAAVHRRVRRGRRTARRSAGRARVPSESRSGPACAGAISAPSVVASGSADRAAAAAVLGQALVERAEREPRLRDHRHIVGLVRDDAVHARERNAEHRRRAADLARACARHRAARA